MERCERRNPYRPTTSIGSAQKLSEFSRPRVVPNNREFERPPFGEPVVRPPLGRFRPVELPTI